MLNDQYARLHTCTASIVELNDHGRDDHGPSDAGREAGVQDGHDTVPARQRCSCCGGHERRRWPRGEATSSLASLGQHLLQKSKDIMESSNHKGFKSSDKRDATWYNMSLQKKRGLCLLKRVLTDHFLCWETIKHSFC